jgi:hypothetical protein
MGVRRERPASERLGNSVRFRFPDGSTKTVPVDDLRTPVTADICCFCGQAVERSAPDRIWLTAQWAEEGQEQMQNWGAHHACFAERMHGAVAGTGPFFGD